MSIRLVFIVLICCFWSQLSVSHAAITYYHTDQLGSPVAASDANGDVLWKVQYYPFGDKIVWPLSAAGATDAAENTRYFTAHVDDVDTGLTYMQARYYDPVVGRFLGVDKVGFTTINLATFNRYSYAKNNPYVFVDTNGMWSAKAHSKILSHAFGDRLPGISIAIMQVESVVHDVSSQSAEEQFMHSMAGEGQSPEEAKMMRNSFIKDQLDIAANRELSKTERHSAMTKAFHAITDSFSPAHVDSDGNLLTYEGENKELHTVFEGQGIEGEDDLTDDMLDQMSEQLNDALDYIQGVGPFPESFY